MPDESHSMSFKGLQGAHSLGNVPAIVSKAHAWLSHLFYSDLCKPMALLYACRLNMLFMNVLSVAGIACTAVLNYKCSLPLIRSFNAFAYIHCKWHIYLFSFLLCSCDQF
jgi:hypothetical protein